jgi:hypothetical protein
MCDAFYKAIQHHFKILLQIDLPDDDLGLIFVPLKYSLFLLLPVSSTDYGGH